MTAKDFLIEQTYNNLTPEEEMIVLENIGFSSDQIIEAMVLFAQYHVQNALKTASENAETDYPYSGVDKPSILNAYPLSNIK